VFDDLRYARWAHTPFTRLNTYTAPAAGAESSSCAPAIPVAALASPGAPTATVSPLGDSARLAPNRSPAPVFDALR
jgi:hypothetical protein